MPSVFVCAGMCPTMVCLSLDGSVFWMLGSDPRLMGRFWVLYGTIEGE